MSNNFLPKINCELPLVLLLVGILIMAIMPPVFHGAEDEGSLLTPDEQYFIGLLKYKIERAREVVSWYRNFKTSRGYETYKSGTFVVYKPKDDADRWRAYKQNLVFSGCSLLKAPGSFKDIQTDWNNDICSRLTKISSVVERDFVPDITLQGWLALGRSVEDEYEYIEDRLNDMAKDLDSNIAEVIQIRKEAQEITKKPREEAKQEAKQEADCFVATAAYGTPTAREIDTLRRFRDEFLRKSSYGNAFIQFYYACSPPLADFISEHEIVRTVVRDAFIDSIVTFLEMTSFCWAE